MILKTFLYDKFPHLYRLFAGLVLAGATLCSYWSLRIGWADWLARTATEEGTTRSIELAPGNSTYLQYRAITSEDNGGDGTTLRLRAAQLNPLDSGNWIRLAARAEGQNEIGEAERDLLRAFTVDRQFEPRWALANYYFRRGDRDRALQWARSTLEFGGGDLKAVFQLCWNITSNGREIFAKAIPIRLEVLKQYLQYLDGNGKLEPGSDVAYRLMPIAEAAQAPALTEHVSRCLNTGRVADAMTLWNGLVSRGLLAGETVAPQSGKSVVNRDFAREFTGVGFDWGVQPIDGVVVERQPNGSGVRVVFLRNEPESCVILGQYAALAPNRRYVFRVRYETMGMSGVGTKWVIYDPATKAVFASAGPSEENTAGEHTLESHFRTLPDCQLARIELRYARESGTVRPEGSIRFSHLELEFAP